MGLRLFSVAAGCTLLAAGIAACAFDWDRYDPRHGGVSAGGSSAAGGGGTGAVGGTGALGGTGGQPTSGGSGGIGGTGPTGGGGQGGQNAGGSMPTNATVLFLHHGTGGTIWGGGVANWILSYNAANATSYIATEITYPTDPYPFQNNPFDYWHLWVEKADPGNHGQADLETLTATYSVIVFKHCYPVSAIEADTGTSDVTSETKTIENYTLQYQALKTKMHEFPDNRFIVWTGAALALTESNAEEGALARQFFTWVKNDWDEPGDNIFVWDFYELETEGGDFIKPEYADGGSGPNGTFAGVVAPFFAQRMVDVIEGRGDSASITGQ